MAVTSITDESADPLEELDRRISEARGVDAAEFEISEVDGADPIDNLRELIAAEVAELGSRREPLSRPLSAESHEPTEVTDRSPATRQPDLAARLGRELLEMIADEPLGGDVRIEAVRRTLEAVDSPTKANVRRILRLLVGLEQSE